jgi:ferrous iron transport protein B
MTTSVALVGNPNCGKTTLFNALTASRQHVGNWPGVTVERKSGYFTQAAQRVEVVDLPGVYSLIQASETGAVDEHLACDFIFRRQADVIINIVDASHLERHLYLTTQLIEMGAPIILALNMMDVVKAQQLLLDTEALARELGCPVVALEAKKGGGIEALKQAILSYDKNKMIPCKLPYPEVIQEAIQDLASEITEPSATWLATRLLEDDHSIIPLVPTNTLSALPKQQARIREALGEDADILLADTRYRFIEQCLKCCLSRPTVTQKTWTNRLDDIVLNRVLGLPVFLGVMYLLFVFAINLGGAFQDFFDLSSQTIFVDGFAHWLTVLGAPTWVIALLANGVGKGINTTVTFIPVLGAMFLFLALLEDSGYMARAAFVIDRFMRMLGLPGKAFVPMIVGFGCNVPAVMGARTLENKRDRILTVMMTPFMSCGARLAIFAVFTAAFFPQGGQNVVFALYLIGIALAILTGLLLRKTVLKGEPSPLVMELPLYHLPHVKTVLLHAWQRLSAFLFRAGRLIVPICVLIGALNVLTIEGSMVSGEGDTRSLLSLVGKQVTPVFAPMGIKDDNWPATVGLVTGVLAKEVVVGTLNSLYTQMGQTTGAHVTQAFQLWPGLQAALASVPQNLAELVGLSNNASVEPALTQGVYGTMYQQFDGKVGAFAYLLFVLLYFPCISTMAVMLRELHRAWAIFSALWMTGVAYGAAVGFYQAATWARHPQSSTLWLVSIVTTLGMAIVLARWIANAEAKQKKRMENLLPLGEVR